MAVQNKLINIRDMVSLRLGSSFRTVYVSDNSHEKGMPERKACIVCPNDTSKKDVSYFRAMLCSDSARVREAAEDIISRLKDTYAVTYSDSEPHESRLHEKFKHRIAGGKVWAGSIKVDVFKQNLPDAMYGWGDYSFEHELPPCGTNAYRLSYIHRAIRNNLQMMVSNYVDANNITIEGIVSLEIQVTSNDVYQTLTIITNKES